MTDRDTGFAHKSARGRVILATDEFDFGEVPRLDLERCHQCHFPWSLHGKRYDAEEKTQIRFCSEYPARPVKSIQQCIVP
jgi:hypothetical protein